MSTADKAALARAARETALAIAYDIIDDIARHGILTADPNSYTLDCEAEYGFGSISLVPGIEPDEIDVVLIAANGATARIRGRVLMMG